MSSVTNSSSLGSSILDQLNGSNESTIDVSTVVEALLSTETGIDISNLTDKLNDDLSKQTAFDLLNSVLSGFSSIMDQLSGSMEDVGKVATLADESVADVTVSDDVVSGKYSMEVLNLASKQSVSSDVYTSKSSLVGSGTLEIEMGQYSGTFNGSGSKVSIDVSAGTTVEQLVDQINNSGSGVTAYLINTSSGVQIAMSSKETGAENGFAVTVVDTDGVDTDNVGLSSLQFNDTTQNMISGQTASDSQVLLDGVMLSSANNTFNNVIDGFSFEVNKVNLGSPTFINVQDDIEGGKELLNEFIDSYNQVIDVFNHLTDTEEGEDSQGALFRDRDFRLIKNSFIEIAEQAVSGYGGNAYLNSLGVRFSGEEAFKLELDEDIFESKLAEDPNSVHLALSQVATMSDSNIKFVSAESYTVAGTYEPLTVTTVAEKAKLYGAFSGDLVIDDTNDTFSIEIDGISSGDINISQGTYASAYELAVELQKQINSKASESVNVSYDGTQFVVDSGVYGSSSTISFDSMDAGFATVFGFTQGEVATGVDVVAKVGESVAIGQGQLLEVLTGDAAGLKLLVDVDVVGDFGSVVVTDGASKTFSDFVADMNSSTGYFTQLLNNYEENIERKNEKISDLEDYTEILRVRYTQQYSELNSSIIAMQAIEEQLQSQFDAWNNQ